MHHRTEPSMGAEQSRRLEAAGFNHTAAEVRGCQDPNWRTCSRTGASSRSQERVMRELLNYQRAAAESLQGVQTTLQEVLQRFSTTEAAMQTLVEGLRTSMHTHCRCTRVRLAGEASNDSVLFKSSQAH